MNENYEQIKTLFNTENVRRIKVFYDDGRSEVLRLGRTADDELIYMLPRSTKRGRYLKYLSFKSFERADVQTNIKDKWEKSLKKAILLLKNSGLWADNLNEYELALSIGYDKIKQAYDITSLNFNGLDYNQTQLKRVELIKQLEPRLIKTTFDGNEKKESYNTDILWYMSNPLKIKKMNFGTDSERILTAFNDALKQNKNFSATGRTSYDVSLEYNAENKKAWYSEEFKGCGNGHYYLALSNTHAVHYEDD